MRPNRHRIARATCDRRDLMQRETGENAHAALRPIGREGMSARHDLQVTTLIAVGIAEL